MADEEDNKMKLDDDQLAQLAELVTARVLESQSNNRDDDDESVKKKKKESSSDGSQLTPDQIADAVMAKIQNNTNAENKKVFDTLWGEKFEQAVNSVPGLKEFVESEDDYGDTRLDRLNGIENYEDRVSALNKLTNSFKEASAGKPGRRPIVNKAAEKKAKEAEDSYSELDKKASSGEYNNVGQMTDDFFKAMAKEFEGMS